MKTEPQIIRQYLERARYYALLLMGNASYIQEELRPMTMSDELREKLNALCSDLIDTKLDLFHEIFEIDELITSSQESPAIAKGAERMQQWMLMSSHSFREGVDEVQKAVQEGTAEFLVQMLLMRCAINILNCIPSPPEFGKNSDPEPEEATDPRRVDKCKIFSDVLLSKTYEVNVDNP